MAWTESEMTVEEMRKEVSLTYQDMKPPTEEELKAAGQKLTEIFGDVWRNVGGDEAEKVYDWDKPFLEKNNVTSNGRSLHETL